MKPSQFFGSLLIFIWLVTFFLGDNLNAVIAPHHAAELLARQWWILAGGLVLLVIGSADSIRRQREHARQNRASSSIQQQVVKRSNPELYGTVRETKANLDDAAAEKTHATKISRTTDTNSLSGIQKQPPHRPGKRGKTSADLASLALKVDWSPLAGGGANFKTGHLVQRNAKRIETRTSGGMKLFSGAFIGIGTGIPVLFAVLTYVDRGFDWELIAPLLFGLLFTSVGIIMLRFPRPRIFDRQLGWFWAGNPSLKKPQAFQALKKAIPLDQLAALQIVPEQVSGKNSSYTSWELNLVADDARRFNVLDHGNKAAIDQDARLLSQFLDLPVWEHGPENPT